MAGAEQVLGRMRTAPLRGRVEAWDAAWRGWAAAHPVALRRLAIARAALLWLGLLHVTVLYVAVPELRPGLRVWLQSYWLLIAWYLLARTKTLPWRAYAGLFAVSVPWALVVAWLTSELAGSAGVDGAGPRTAIAALGEEALKLVPLAVVAAVVPGRVRRFAAADWVLAGIASGLGFQAFEDLVRRLVVAYEVGTLGGLQGLDSGFPQYGWSPLAGGSSVPGAGYAGHHVFTGLVAAGVGLGVWAWRRRAPGWRVVAVALPLLLWWTAVVDHLGFNASQADLSWVDGPDPSVPWVIRAWWSGTGHGFGRGWLLLLLLVAAMLVDARRLTAGARRGRDALQGLPFAPLAFVSTGAGRLTQGATVLGAFAARDAAFVLAALARDPDEPARAGIGRGRRAGTVARLARLDTMTAETPAPGAERRTRLLALAALAAAAVAALALGPALAHAIGPSFTDDGAWLAGLLDRLGDWWAGQSTAEKIVYAAGLAALVALSGGSLGLAIGVSGAAAYTLDHARGAATLARDPRSAVRDYALTTTPAGSALDALAFGLTFAPGNFAGAAAGRAVRTALDDAGEDSLGWAVRRREAVAAATDAQLPLDVTDFTALRWYTGRGYGQMNHALRHPEAPVPPDVRRRIDALDAALAKLEPHEGWVHRGVELADTDIARYLPGRYVTEMPYTSTTMTADDRFSGKVHMIIRSHTGRDVSPFSQVPAEREVLFRRGTTFFVHERTFDREAQEWIIVLTERKP